MWNNEIKKGIVLRSRVYDLIEHTKNTQPLITFLNIQFQNYFLIMKKL